MFRKIVTSFLLALVGMVGFFGNIEKGNIESTAGVIKYAITGNEVHAADNWTGPIASNGEKNQGDGNKSSGANTQDEETRKMLNSIVAGLNIILDILTILVSPAIILAGWLMSPDWTSGDIFGIRPMIHQLWITVSNIVYFIYAVLLIFIALATIFNSDHYGYKALLPKLAIGILMVPLTWWMVQFIISVASYVTVSVITIPQGTIEKFVTDKNTWWYGNSIPRKIIYENDKTIFSSENGAKKEEAGSEKSFCNEDGKDPNCISPSEFMSNAGGSFSPLMIYSFGVFKFQKIKEVPAGTINTIKTIGQLINQGIVGALMFMVFGILVLALIFMLAMRAIRLWFYAIFSPLFTLQYVVGDSVFGENKDTFSIKEFLGLAFAPALVGLALSFGLIVISVLMDPGSTGPEAKNGCKGNSCSITLFGNSKSTITTSVGEDKKTETIIALGGMTYTFKGSITGDTTTTQDIKSALNITGGIFGTIIIDIIALIFVWVAFMAAKGVSKAVSAAIDPFEKMGKKIGDMGMALPKYTPIPGIGLSAKGMEKVVEKAQYGLDTAHEKETNEQIAKMFPGLAPKNMATVEDINSVRQAISNHGKNNPEEVLNKIGSIQSAGRANDETSIKLFLEKTSPELKTMDKEKIRATLMTKGVEKDRADEVVELIFEPEKLNGEKRIRAMSTLGSKFGNSINKTTAKVEELIEITPHTSIKLGGVTWNISTASKNEKALQESIAKFINNNPGVTQEGITKRLEEAHYPDAKKVVEEAFKIAKNPPPSDKKPSP